MYKILKNILNLITNKKPLNPVNTVNIEKFEIKDVFYKFDFDNIDYNQLSKDFAAFIKPYVNKGLKIKVLPRIRGIDIMADINDKLDSSNYKYVNASSSIIINDLNAINNIINSFKVCVSSVLSLYINTYYPFELGLKVIIINKIPNIWEYKDHNYNEFRSKGLLDNYANFLYRNFKFINGKPIPFNTKIWLHTDNFKWSHVKHKYEILYSSNNDYHTIILNKNKKIICFDYIENNINDIIIINSSIDLDTKYLKPLELSKKEHNYLIMTLDIETYSDDNGNQIPYCIAFYNNFRDEFKSYYKEGNIDIIKDCLCDIINSRNSGYTIYVHNLSGFDGIFLYNYIIKIAPESEVIWRDNQIIGVEIKIPNKGGTIHLRDSYLILPSSLESLAQKFGNMNLAKGKFPYKFINESNLNYRGLWPDIKYYNNISKDVYDSIKGSIFDVKSETIKYIKKDVYILSEIMFDWANNIYKEYKIHPDKLFTITGLAFKIYRSVYYPKLKDRIIELSPSINNIFRKGYMGGIVNIFLPYGKNVYYYDINSLYPYVMKKYLYPVNKMTYSCHNKDLNTIFGMVHAHIQSPKDMKYPFLAVKSDKGIINPLGKWKGWYTSEELKYALTLGYKIDIIESYSFEKGDIFSEYVRDFYNKKDLSLNDLYKLIYKRILNSLYGRLGINQSTQSITTISKNDTKTLTELISKHDVYDIREVDNKYIIIHNKFQSLDNNDNYIEPKTLSSNVAISAFITAYARIEMHKIIMILESKGIKINYTDTDSVVISEKLPDNLIGRELGLWKNEYPNNNIVEAYFLAPKSYALKLDTGEIIVKWKGINLKGMSWDLVERIYLGETIYKSTNKFYKINKIEGIQIKELSFKLVSSYNKGHKVYDSNGLWIATKPFTIHED